MVKKIFFQIKQWYKKGPLFLLQALTHYSFTFDLKLLYELNHMVFLTKTVSGIFHFQFCFVFIEVIFFFNKIHGLIKGHNSFQD